jgi:hypothetical protein
MANPWLLIDGQAKFLEVFEDAFMSFGTMTSEAWSRLPSLSMTSLGRAELAGIDSRREPLRVGWENRILNRVL